MLSRTILVATVAALSITSYAFAQTGPQRRPLVQGEATLIHHTGKMQIVKISGANEEKMIKAGRELPAGAVIYHHGGHIYIIENKPAAAPGGKTSIQTDYPGLIDDSWY